MADYASQASTTAYGGLAAGNATGAAQARVELQSTNILTRLNSLQKSLYELNASADSAAQKIVGSMPTPLTNSTAKQTVDRDPSCFLDALSQAVSELESIEADLRNNVNRLHRHF
jgi:hypothetical protein